MADGSGTIKINQPFESADRLTGVKYNARAAKEVRYPSISPRVLDFDHVNGPEIIALDPTKYKLEDLVVTLVYYNSGFEDVQVLLLPPVSGNCRMDYENEVGSYCRPAVVKRDDDEISVGIFQFALLVQ
ncbi:hypothetical protein PMZ80_010382 [Knufia obscura]|uniref:Uncharacterized protein n=1 Tax=Knufia obscura TaxID=1635080 RepID=A0ABR0R9T3_9EURO|nr:hypothetical protein PMZ80_010382 [Knufia obscura]